MGTRVRVEVGNRIVEVVAETREEALKAFKFAVRGVFATQDEKDDFTVRWRVGRFDGRMQLVNAQGAERMNKIHAIKQLRELTSLGLREAKQAIESGYYPAASKEEADRIRVGLTGHVTFAE
jgi:ribosomal protein L7/L12